MQRLLKHHTQRAPRNRVTPVIPVAGIQSIDSLLIPVRAVLLARLFQSERIPEKEIRFLEDFESGIPLQQASVIEHEIRSKDPFLGTTNIYYAPERRRGIYTSADIAEYTQSLILQNTTLNPMMREGTSAQNPPAYAIALDTAFLQDEQTTDAVLAAFNRSKNPWIIFAVGRTPIPLNVWERIKETTAEWRYEDVFKQALATHTALNRLLKEPSTQHIDAVAYSVYHTRKIILNYPHLRFALRLIGQKYPQLSVDVLAIYANDWVDQDMIQNNQEYNEWRQKNASGPWRATPEIREMFPTFPKIIYLIPDTFPDTIETTLTNLIRDYPRVAIYPLKSASTEKIRENVETVYKITKQIRKNTPDARKYEQRMTWAFSQLTKYSNPFKMSFAPVPYTAKTSAKTSEPALPSAPPLNEITMYDRSPEEEDRRIRDLVAMQPVPAPPHENRHILLVDYSYDPDDPLQSQWLRMHPTKPFSYMERVLSVATATKAELYEIIAARSANGAAEVEDFEAEMR